MTTFETERQRSLPSLVREVIDEANELLREELRLAQAETAEKLHALTRSLVSIGMGVALALASVLVLAAALNRGLTVLLARAVGLEVAAWLAPLLLGATLGVTGWILVHRGTARIKSQTLMPEQTRDVLVEEKEWLKQKLS